jgi:predicted O-methyltransferase YrrM
MNRAEVVLRAKSGYVRASHAAGRALTRIGVLGEAVPPRDHRVRHWAYSLSRVHDSLAIAELDVPWWTYRATDAVDRWLAARARPIRIFEYGSGASTLWLARRADEVHTVEHDRAFAESVATAMARPGNVDLRIVEAVVSNSPVIGSAKEGAHGLDFVGYVAAIDTVPGEFDVIVIDGRAREACLRRAVPRLATDGIIVFDNTRRRRYRRAIDTSGLVEQRFHGLTPTLPYPDQTSILRSRSSSS